MIYQESELFSPGLPYPMNATGLDSSARGAPRLGGSSGFGRVVLKVYRLITGSSGVRFGSEGWVSIAAGCWPLRFDGFVLDLVQLSVHAGRLRSRTWWESAMRASIGRFHALFRLTHMMPQKRVFRFLSHQK